MTDLSALDAKLDQVLAALKNAPRPLLTIPEVAARYRVSKEEVRRLIDAGELRAAMRKPRRGSVGYVVDAKDAERVLGAR